MKSSTSDVELASGGKSISVSIDSGDQLLPMITDTQREALINAHKTHRCGLPLLVVLLAIVTVASVIPTSISLSLTTTFTNDAIKERASRENEINIEGYKMLVERQLINVEQIGDTHRGLIETQTFDMYDQVGISKSMLQTVRNTEVSFMDIIATSGYIAGSIGKMSDTVYSWLEQSDDLMDTCAMVVNDLDSFTISNTTLFCMYDVNPAVVISAMLGTTDMFIVPREWSGIVLQATTVGLVPEICFSQNIFINGTLRGRIIVGWFISLINSVLNGISIVGGNVYVVEANNNILLGGTNGTGSRNVNDPTIPVNATNLVDFKIADATIQSIYGGWNNIPVNSTAVFSTIEHNYLICTTRLSRNGLNWVLVSITKPDLQKVKGSIYGIIIGIVVGVILMMTIFGCMIVRPLRKISKEILDISQLKFNKKHAKTSWTSWMLCVFGISEMQQLLVSYNRFSGGIKALTKYVPPEVVVDLMTRSDGSVDLDMKKMPLTIMFVDLKDFTGNTEKLSNEQTMILITTWFKIFGNTIAIHQGTIDKFIGDCIMAIYGAPHAIDRPEYQACATAIAFKTDMEIVNRKLGRKIPIKYRVGIHSDQTLVGNIGYPDRVNYTVCGNTPAIANRLEESGKNYGITPLVSDEIVKKCESDFLFVLLDIVRVRGHNEKWTPIYHLVGYIGNATEDQIAVSKGYMRIHRRIRNGRNENARELIEKFLGEAPFKDYTMALRLLDTNISLGKIEQNSYADISMVRWGRGSEVDDNIVLTPDKDKDGEHDVLINKDENVCDTGKFNHMIEANDIDLLNVIDCNTIIPIYTETQNIPIEVNPLPGAI